MNAACELYDGSTGFEFVFVEDGLSDLPALTERLADFCSRLEARRQITNGLLIDIRPANRVWPPRATTHELARWEREVRRLERLPALTIACVDGACTGPAFDLLLVADYRIASADATVALAANKGEVWPGMALYRLVQQVGGGHARRMSTFGHPIDAEHALAMGLVDEVTADLRGSLAKASQLANQRSGAEPAIRRRLVLEAPSASYENALGAHLAACARELERLNAVEIG